MEDGGHEVNSNIGEQAASHEVVTCTSVQHSYEICIGCGDAILREDLINFPRFCSLLYPCQLLRYYYTGIKSAAVSIYSHF